MGAPTGRVCDGEHNQAQARKRLKPERFLAIGELAIRTDTGVVFTKKDDGTVAEIAGGGAINDLTDAVTNSSG